MKAEAEEEEEEEEESLLWQMILAAMAMASRLTAPLQDAFSRLMRALSREAAGNCAAMKMAYALRWMSTKRDVESVEYFREETRPLCLLV